MVAAAVRPGRGSGENIAPWVRKGSQGAQGFRSPQDDLIMRLPWRTNPESLDSFCAYSRSTASAGLSQTFDHNPASHTPVPVV